MPRRWRAGRRVDPGCRRGDVVHRRSTGTGRPHRRHPLPRQPLPRRGDESNSIIHGRPHHDDPPGDGHDADHGEHSRAIAGDGRLPRRRDVRRRHAHDHRHPDQRGHHESTGRPRQPGRSPSARRSRPATTTSSPRTAVPPAKIASSDALDLTVAPAPPDVTPPTATAPKAAFVTGSTLSSGLTPVRLTWAGHDSGTGIDHFQLARSTDGGSWTAPTTLAGTSVVQGLRGHEYRFRVRAIDGAGNVGRWMPGPSVQVRRVGEARSTVHYRGPWLDRPASAGWAAPRSTARRPAPRFRSRSPGGQSPGSASPRPTAARRASSSTAPGSQRWISAPPRPRRNESSGRRRSRGRRRERVTIKVVGTAHRPRVDVDGFLVGR